MDSNTRPGYVFQINEIFWDASSKLTATAIRRGSPDMGIRNLYILKCESKKNPPPLKFSDIFSQMVGNFYPKFDTPTTHSYLRWLQIFIQLPATLTGWSRLIWHNFVTVGDNWIKISTLACMWTFNRHVKFGLKIPDCWGKMSENATARFCRWRTFCTHDVNWVVMLNMA